jgi:uncharacterized protein (TIGR02646 family)
MIQITRPDVLPSKLQASSEEAKQKVCDEHDGGSREFTFQEDIYKHSSVVDACLEMQHFKCPYCEQFIGKDGDIEHFRPKAAFQQEKGQELKKPGYYWLAYEWSNLFRSCIPCNQRWKKNLFPLADEGKRCDCHTGNLNDEEPLLIDPTRLDPEELIGWREEYPFPKNDDPRARKTIEVLGLREGRNLESARRMHLNDVKRYLKIIQAARANPADPELQNDASEARDGLQEKLADTAPFLAMTRAYLAAQNFPP